jgi:dipeptidase D
LRNAIPRESRAVLALAAEDVADFREAMIAYFEGVKAEYATTDPDLELVMEACEAPEEAMPEDVQEALLLAIQACPVGIHRMSPDLADLVQTSNNLARVQVSPGKIVVQCLCRSSVDTEKWDHARSIQAAFALAGLDTEFSGSYPGWTPNPQSAIVSLLKDLYVERYGEQPHVLACHAGLECGILGTNYPEMDMVSFGPNIRGAHSPDERVQISSVQKFWGYLLDALTRIPEAHV